MSGQRSASSEDRLLGGRVIFHQPLEGYRVAIDPVLLAAAIPAQAGEAVLELGSGAGAAFLCLLARCPDIRVTAIERDPAMAAFAEKNAALNGWEARVELITGGLDRAAAGAFDQVLFNPPYLEAARAVPSGQAGRDDANIEGEAGLLQWIGTGLRALRPRGRLTLIQRADRLGDILTALEGPAGEIVVFPLWPKTGRDARRVIVTARKGLRAPLRLASGLVLHGETGDFTEQTQAVLAAAQALEISGS